MYAMYLCLLAGLSWASAPLLGRASGVNGMLMTILVAIGTLLATLPFAFSQNYAAVGSKPILLAVLAGVLNGIGLLAFYRLVAGSNEGLWQLSRVAPICYVLVPVCLAIGTKIFFGEAMTSDKFIGIGFACGAIWFLK